MTVRELIEKLGEFDPEMRVELFIDDLVVAAKHVVVENGWVVID